MWRLAAAALIARVRQSMALILLAAALGAGIGVATKLALPPAYKSTAELLIDPRGLKVFADDASASQMDANAAINFVESQMAVIRSDRVMLRVVRELDLAQPSGTVSNKSAETAETRALAKLQRLIAVQRAERSFVVGVTATSSTPDAAARLANAIVAAYLAEDALDRSGVAKRLTAELTGRLDTLRSNLRAAETKAENFRVENGLVGAQDRLVVEQRLTEATTALSVAQNREAQARARLKQLSDEPLDISSMGLAGNDAESRRLSALLDRQAMARADLAQLSATLGARHPALESARNRVSEAEAGIRDALGSVRKAAKAEVDRAQSETAALSRNLAALTADVAAVRRAEVELRALERDVDSDRKILDSFETRAREASEFGQIDRTYTRVVSPARAPTPSGGLVGLVAWGIAAAVMAAMLMLSAFAVAVMLAPISAQSSRDAAAAARRRRDQMEEGEIAVAMAAVPAPASVAAAAFAPVPAAAPVFEPAEIAETAVAPAAAAVPAVIEKAAPYRAPKPAEPPVQASAGLLEPRQVLPVGPRSEPPRSSEPILRFEPRRDPELIPRPELGPEPRIVMVRPPAPTSAPPIFAPRTAMQNWTVQTSPARVAAKPPETATPEEPAAARQLPARRKTSGQWRFLS
ncbi:MAG: Wzz/FepE/Etk N-terminal domain-containing protein [Ancalomicrobiaceae bacterium]|nr:Wzz/FepE/Etk N-terminal domain-containing protein [Ancalomicrobiaceae bacterium]